MSLKWPIIMVIASLAVLLSIGIANALQDNTPPPMIIKEPAPHVQGVTYDDPDQSGAGFITYLLGGKVYKFEYCLPGWPCSVER